MIDVLPKHNINAPCQCYYIRKYLKITLDYTTCVNVLIQFPSLLLGKFIMLL